MWTPVPGFEGKLEAHPSGRVRNAGTQREYSHRLDRRGYHCIQVRLEGKKKHRRVHRIVAITFLPNPDNLPEVNHKDFNKANCAVGNLEWITRRNNVLHWHSQGPASQLAGRGRPTGVVATHPLLGEMRYGSISEAAADIGAPYASLWDAVKKGREYRGLRWHLA